MQVKEMTVEQLKALIRDVAETLEEFLDDPNRGLKVREEVKQQLLEIQKRKQAGVCSVSAEKVAEKLGLN